MRTLAEPDAAGVASLAGELAALEDVAPFPPDVIGRLATLLRSRNATYCELDACRQAFLYEAWWEEGAGGCGRPDSDRAEDAVWWRLRSQHPMRVYRERTDDWTSAYLMSDFVSSREFRRTEIWAELYRTLGANYWLGVGLTPSYPMHTRMFVFVRERGDFGERERTILELLQPHLQRRHERTRAAADAADAVATLAEQTGDDSSPVVICSGAGTIEFASKRSRRLLSRYFESVGGRLPRPVVCALRAGDPVVVDRGEQRLTLRGISSAGLLVVVTSEQDLRLDRLTPRQRTILKEVATGATNADIADRLAVSAATVDKHLEQIYRRLGVHTRTAAAALLT
jgi:DNA-binding NarL/FixJ family response regulator